MIKEYILKGLSCANCAAKIENALRTHNDILSASVNFMNTTLILEISDTYQGNPLSIIERIVHKYEPDIIVMDKSDKTEKKFTSYPAFNETEKPKIIMFIIGTFIFGTCILLENRFQLNHYIYLSLYLISYLIFGGSVVLKALRNILRGRIFDENFLMSIATLGALATDNFSEAVGVMLFYQIGEYFQESAVRNSKKSITDLMDIRPDFATLKKNNEWITVLPETVMVGDIICVKPGEKIPLDGIVTKGESLLDTKALTGEPAPKIVSVSDTIISGCINQTGVLEIEVTKTFGDSTVTKIIDLVENASSKKAPAENFITSFSKYYTPVVVGLAFLIAFIPPLLFHGLWTEWVNRALILLVISCPCALVVSIPLGFFGGIGKASKKGILIKGSNYLEALNKIEMVVFDKTGTLTKGIFSVTRILPANGYSKDFLLKTAANAESMSNHPIARSIMEAFDKTIDRENISDYDEMPGLGICATVDGKKVLAGNSKLMKSEHILFSECKNIGTKIYVAMDGIYVGCLVVSDEVKEDSKDAIAQLKSRGMKKVVMLTGDNSNVSKEISDTLGLDEVYGDLLPDQKVEKMELFLEQKSRIGKLAFVGDGINDAPVLARADVGIAMGALGSDAAIEAADLVLMTDEPSKLIDAIDIAKHTHRIVWQNIIFALGIKVVFLILGALGVASMWEAVFADVGVSILAILNSMRV